MIATKYFQKNIFLSKYPKKKNVKNFLKPILILLNRGKKIKDFVHNTINSKKKLKLINNIAFLNNKFVLVYFVILLFTFPIISTKIQISRLMNRWI